MKGRIAQLLSPPLLFAAAVVLAVPFLLYVHRDIGPFQDEWEFILDHHGISADSLLSHLNGQVMATIAVILTVVEELFSPASTWPLAVISVAAQVLVACMVWTYTRGKANDWYALAAGVLVLFLGAGWEIVVWSFNIGWKLGVAAGIGALVLFERRDDRLATVLAALLLVFGIFSSGSAAPFIAALAVYALWPETRRRALATIAPAVILFGLWKLTYGAEFAGRRTFLTVPETVYEVASHGFGGLFGAGPELGAAIAVAAVIGLLIVFSRAQSIERSATVALCLPLAFWMILGLERSDYGFFHSRYMYSSIILILLAGAHFVQYVRVTAPVKLAAAVLFAFAFVGQLQEMQDGARYLRGGSSATLSFVSALGMTDRADATSPDFSTEDKYQFSDEYKRTRIYDWLGDRGSEFAVTAEEVAAGPAYQKDAVDAALVALSGYSLEGASEPREPGSELKVDAGAPPAVLEEDGCLSVPGGTDVVVSTPDNWIFIDSKAPVGVKPMRFAPAPVTEEKLEIPSGGHNFAMNAGKVEIPWRYQLSSLDSYRVCG